MPRQYWAMS